MNNEIMDDIDRKQLYTTAWKHYGAEMQLDITIEEMAEFIQAILKTRRNGVVYSHSFFEELADVLICLEQIETVLKEILSTKNHSFWDLVIEIKNKKLERLHDRLVDDIAEKHSGLGEKKLFGER